MRTLATAKKRRVSENIAAAGVVLGGVSLLGIGLHSIYALLSNFPTTTVSLGGLGVWLAGVGLAVALCIWGTVIRRERAKPVEESHEQRRGPARAA